MHATTIKQAITAAAASLLVAAAAATPASGSPAPRSTSATSLSRTPVPVDERWRSLVEDPASAYAYPRAVLVQGDAGAVDNASGLAHPGHGVTVIHASAAGSPTLLLDLGVDTGGTIEVGVAAGVGTPLHLAYAEARRYLSPFGDNVEGSLGTNDVPDGRFDVFPAVGGLSWTSPAVRGGERWISLTLDAPGSVALDYVRVHVSHLRSSVGDYGGHFLSNDDVVNRSWYASAYTYDTSVTANTAVPGSPPVLMDGAKRDRMVFEGDLGLGQLTGLDAVRAGPQVSRDSLQIFSCQQSSNGDIPGFTNTAVNCPEDPPAPAPADTNVLRSGEYLAWYIVAADDYLWRTGDGAYVTKLLPVLRRAAGYLRANSSGGLYTGSHDPAVEFGWQAGGGSGAGSYTNVVFYRAMRALADLERRLGDGATAAAADAAVAEQIRAALVAQAFDPATGAFRQSSADTTGTHPQDANVEAVVAGILTGRAADRALRFVRDRMWTQFGTQLADKGNVYISPFMSSWELIARLQRHDTTAALQLIRTEWGHMQATDPNYTAWEKVGLDGLPQPNQANPGALPTWRPEGEGYVSLSHAWSTGPVAALSEYVLGLRATKPSFDGWTVDPQPGDLRWAQGQLPTPHGPLLSRWERGAGDRSFRLTAGGPAGTSGSVVVPLLGSDRTIDRDGRPVWRGGAPVAGVDAVRDGDRVRFEHVAGIHTYAWVGP